MKFESIVYNESRPMLQLCTAEVLYVTYTGIIIISNLYIPEVAERMYDVAIGFDVSPLFLSYRQVATEHLEAELAPQGCRQHAIDGPQEPAGQAPAPLVDLLPPRVDRTTDRKTLARPQHVHHITLVIIRFGCCCCCGHCRR